MPILNVDVDAWDLNLGKIKGLCMGDSAMFQYLLNLGQEEMGFCGTKRELSYQKEGLYLTTAMCKNNHDPF